MRYRKKNNFDNRSFLQKYLNTLSPKTNNFSSTETWSKHFSNFLKEVLPKKINNENIYENIRPRTSISNNSIFNHTFNIRSTQLKVPRKSNNEFYVYPNRNHFKFKPIRRSVKVKKCHTNKFLNLIKIKLEPKLQSKHESNQTHARKNLRHHQINIKKNLLKNNICTLEESLKTLLIDSHKKTMNKTLYTNKKEVLNKTCNSF